MLIKQFRLAPIAGDRAEDNIQRRSTPCDVPVLIRDSMDRTGTKNILLDLIGQELFQ